MTATGNATSSSTPGTIVEKVLFLKETDIFSQTAPDALLNVAAVADEVFTPARQVIFAEGDLSDYLYLVISGKVQITRDEKELFVALPHKSFGLVGLVEEQPRATASKAAEDTRLFKIGHDDLFDLMEDHSEITKGVLRGLTKVLREIL